MKDYNAFILRQRENNNCSDVSDILIRKIFEMQKSQNNAIKGNQTDGKTPHKRSDEES